MDPIVTARIAQAQQAEADRLQRIVAWQAAAPALKVMAHGDSWFDYPDILGTGGGVPDHLSALLNVPILNMAHHGDATEQMLSIPKRKQLESNIVGKDILLFSGGGNDIAGDQFCLWLFDNEGQPIENAIDMPRLLGKMAEIHANYLDLIQIRDKRAPNCLLVTHAYDFPIPSDVGVCGLGPWLKPSLEYCGWVDPTQQFLIVKTVMQAFNAMLVALESDELARGAKHLHVPTQGTLGAGDWANEIHPNRGGFEKIAVAFQTSLELNLS